MPKRTDIRKVLVIGSGPIVIGQAVRVRLLGHPGHQGAARGGRGGGPAQQQPGHGDDRPGVRPPHLHRAHHRRGRRADHRRASARTRCCRRWAARRRSTSPRRSPSRASSRSTACGSSAPRSRPSTRPRTGSSSRRRCRRSAWRCRRAATPPRSTRRMALVEDIGFPAIIRPSLHPGRHRRRHRLQPRRVRGRSAARASRPAPPPPSWSRRACSGWKEFELEVVRDTADNVIIVCSIENLDPMGVHTGDSITVAPGADADRQGVPAAARRPRCAIIREIGVDTGGSNIQFGVNPQDGRMVVIEMNPRVSRSSRAGLQGHRATPSRRSPRSWRWATRWTS